VTWHPAQIAHDLPAGGKQLVQRADGYVMALVAGTPVFEPGQPTGAMPRGLVRRRKA
jgi:N-acyl-D-aspartate/D-glutamate deacylase